MPATVAPTIGDERADEDDHGEGQREWHPEDGEADADPGRVDERDDRGAAYVAAECPDRRGADPVPALEASTGERAQEERPDAVAVLEEEEQHHDGEEGSRDEFGGDGHAGDRAGPELAAGEEVGDRAL